jgi:predicted transglutaminase-like cysteine proteinase
MGNHIQAKRVAAFAAVFAVLAGAAMARDDAGGGWGGAPDIGSAVANVAPHRAAADYARELDAVEPAAGRGTLVASTPRDIAAPRITLPSSAGKRFGAFGSVAISAGKLPAAYKWRGVTGRNYGALFGEDCARSGLSSCDSKLAKTLRKARATATGQSALAAIRTVDAAVNKALRYGSDRAVWGKGDYWATPSEIARKGIGDCEDFAVTKYWLLRSLGFDAQQLQLVVLLDTRRGIYHAVLAVHLDGTRYILDNLSTRVATDAASPAYMPIMSFVGAKSYIHGFENRRSETARMPKDLGAVMPGEGV